MKKLISTFVAVGCCLLMTACGNKEEGILRVTNGVIYNDGVATQLTEHAGNTAKMKMPNGDEVSYYTCMGVDFCEHQNSGATTENLLKYKDSTYLSLYSDTNLYMWYDKGKSRKDPKVEGYYAQKQENYSQTTVEQMNEAVYSNICVIKLGEYTKANFNDIVNVINVTGDMKARKDEIIIPGKLRVRMDDGSIVANEQTTIGDKVVGHLSQGAYDYYFYNGVMIQLATGNNLTTFVELL